MLQANRSLHVVAAIIISEGRVLACRRALHKASPGLWEFPGGKVELGEPPFDAIVREIKEELQLVVQPVKTFNVSETPVADFVIRLECIVVEPLEKFNLQSSDHDAFLWLVPSELPGLNWAAPDLPAVQLLASLSSLEGLL